MQLKYPTSALAEERKSHYLFHFVSFTKGRWKCFTNAIHVPLTQPHTLRSLKRSIHREHIPQDQPGAVTLDHRHRRSLCHLGLQVENGFFSQHS